MKKIFVFIALGLFLVGCAPAAASTSMPQRRSTATATVIQTAGATATQPATATPPAAGTQPAAATLLATSKPTTPVNQSATSTPIPATLPQGNSSGKIPNFDHIVLIILENQDFQNVIGSSKMPHLNALAQQNVLLSNYYAVGHPSLPNYIALMSGSTQNISSDCKDCFVNKTNLADEIENSGRTWKSYLEDMPSPCFKGDSKLYVQKHNPLIYFDSIRLNPDRCNRSIVPLASLDKDLAARQLPNFSFIMPNLCNSGHDCKVDVADNWVNNMVTKLQASSALGENSLIIITFDEGDKDNAGSCCGMGSKAGGQVAAVLISPMARKGFNDNTAYSHYSLLKMILSAWNLTALGETATAPQIIAPWNSPQSSIGRDLVSLPLTSPVFANTVHKATRALSVQAPTTGNNLVFPIRAAFYYPWFPNAWTQQGIYPYTNYHPTLGFYDLADQAIIQQQITSMQYGHIEAGIASWWGQGTQTDNMLPNIFAASAGSSFLWSVYYEPEGQGNPSVSAITADLTYLNDHYGSNPNYLHIDNRFVVFVYADANDGCEMADRWIQANSVNAYIVLKVFPGYRNCASQPDGWHQYAPANASDAQGSFSYTISPGFWKVGESPRLARNPLTWRQNIHDMIASGADFQLITTFNEWGEGTSVESAQEWASGSGYGSYLDDLHNADSDYAVFLPIIQDNTSQTSTSTLDDPHYMDSGNAVYVPIIQNNPSATIIAAGDISDCNLPGDEITAALLDKIAGTVITLGDNVYESGTTAEFNNCYNPTWGRQKVRTHPSVGNHEYMTTGATGYYGYFGAAAGDPSKGYYSYDLGSWHIIVINSNCSQVGGCNANSPQVTWLQADLAAHPAFCTLAYWHHPRFSSGYHGNSSEMQPIWQTLYNAGVELVLNGHDHDYERFAPQTPTGTADPLHGIREFVVGTGGKTLRKINSTIANSEIHNDNTFGVLKLTLNPTGYAWEFIPGAGMTFSDKGSGSCH